MPAAIIRIDQLFVNIVPAPTNATNRQKKPQVSSEARPAITCHPGEVKVFSGSMNRKASQSITAVKTTWQSLCMKMRTVADPPEIDPSGIGS